MGSARWWMIGALVVALVASLVVMDRKMSDTISSGEPASAPALIETLPPLILPRPGEKAVFFGDEWTQGFSATPETEGFAFLTGRWLGAVTEADWAMQSGFVHTAAGGKGTYKDRLLARPVDYSARLMVLQCSESDLAFGKDAAPAARATMSVVRDKFPNAQIVVVGPAPATAQAIDATQSLAAKLLTVAADAGFYVVNPAGQSWIMARNFDAVIDPATKHPSTQGHAYIAGKLIDSLQKLARDGRAD